MALLLALLPGCSGEPEREPPPPDQRAKLLTIPDEYKTMQNPLSASPANQLDGRTRYEAFCSQCHGPDGKAGTLLGRSVRPAASDLTSARVQGYSDGQLFWIVAEGIRYSGMPAGRDMHTEPEMWKIVLYLRALPRGAPPAVPATPAPSSENPPQRPD